MRLRGWTLALALAGTLGCAGITQAPRWACRAVAPPTLDEPLLLAALEVYQSRFSKSAA
jgi:hypothetical protein